VPSEFSIAADIDSGRAYALGFVFDPDRDASDLVILDADDISRPAVARVRLPRRVPQGFHGSWMPRA